MKIGDRVDTPHGCGEIVDWEIEKRYGVKLDNNPFDFPIAYYFPHELKKAKDVQE